MTEAPTRKGQITPHRATKTREWYAWNNMQPPEPNDFHIRGEVEVPNPGVRAVLTRSNPQGINARVLLLDLTLVQRPGYWPRTIVWTVAEYDEVIGAEGYTQADILSEGTVIASTPVKNIT